MNSSLPLSTPAQNPNSTPESTTIQKQRKELQLLIAELKERDKELNDMVAVHQRQLLAWEDDRQKILTLAERCSRLENELHQRNEMITTLTKRLKLLESQQNDRKVVLENTQLKLQELSQKASDTSLHCQALEEKNQALNCSVMELSNKVGQFQAREQELLTMLKLKDNDILEATNHITEFTCKFKKLENALRAARMEESSINREKQDFKHRLKELMLEMTKLRGDLSEKTKENNEQREEIIRLKQENGYLNNELLFSAERATRKDQLLQSAKSKQLRTDTELSNLRQIYAKQQRDLQFLHFNLESSQEAKQKPKKEGQEESKGMALSDLESSSSSRDTGFGEISERPHTRVVYVPGGSLKSSCCACRAKGRPPVGLEERRSASLDPFQEGPFHEQRVPCRQEQKQSSREAYSRPSCELEMAWMMAGREQASEPHHLASLPIHEHWLDLDSSAQCHSRASKLSDMSSGDCKDVEMDAAGIPCEPNPNHPLSPGKALGSGCCFHKSASGTVLYQPVTDREWMQIFKPAKGERGACCQAFAKSPQATPGSKSSKSKSDYDVDLNILDLDAPCLTSTQKMSPNGPKRRERAFSGDLPLELSSSPAIRAANGCCHATTHQDSCSPTNKLQRLLAESRQMVADLELSNLLHASPCCSPKDNCTHTAMEYTDSLCKGRFPATEESEMKLSLFSL
ncbi:hypothetical protein lerEdw1_003594 [Lerista edwardsae]|nr:hypothetical protein lerEdw1_003594 [Lerista edwardsae]